MSENDYLFALMLQEQINVEQSNSIPSQSPSMNSKNSNKENVIRKQNYLQQNDKGSLIDPTWELVDPTPNIHTLFIQFNRKFFWGKLETVAVSWSKRMTTCAGVCSYQGRGGLCSIRLSEPLLKLRPRKDLIETLLHEMIHAYLFVTENNRDRDGHGPEFHKHMYRINNEAGTKITVYHDFHDEVRLYKTHWWRCNGLCQTRRPFFGLVKRATNRAPGPNDRWWAQHQATCGGTFIKIRQPDSKSKKNGGLPTKSEPVSDIRNYIPTNRKQGGVTPITTLKDINGGGRVGGATMMNKGGTLVVQPKTKHSEKTSTVTSNTPINDPNPLRLDTFKPFSGQGNKLTISNSKTKSSKSPFLLNSDDDALLCNATNLVENNEKARKQKTDKNVNTSNDPKSVVRNHWANVVFPSTSSTNDCGLKRTMDSNTESPLKKTKLNETTTKIKKMEDYFNDPSKPKIDNYKETKSTKISDHFDSPSKKESVESDIMFDESNLINSTPEKNSWMDRKSPVAIECVDLTDAVQCPICENWLSEQEINTHVDVCLSKSLNEEDIDAMENEAANSSKSISCLVCNETIEDTKLNEHLEICMNGMFDDDMKEERKDIGDKLYGCPCCPLELKESELNAHLDICLTKNKDQF